MNPPLINTYFHSHPSFSLSSPSSQESQYVVVCPCCEHFNTSSSQAEISSLTCSNCGNTIVKTQNSRKDLTLIFALTALIFYFPANLLPFMTIEMYGNKNEATIWSGIMSLSDSGSWFLALVVFVASMFVPFFKLVALFYLSLIPHKPRFKRYHAKLYHLIEVIGPWSMLDIFLVAVLMTIFKFGSLAQATAGPGSIMFLLVVIFTMLASRSFNDKIIWQEGSSCRQSPPDLPNTPKENSPGALL